MPPRQTISFALLCVVFSATPGPSNMLLAATGARVGLWRGLPCLLGAALGAGSLLFAVALGAGTLLGSHPLVLPALRWCGVAVLGWLAWKLATARRGASGQEARPIGPLGAAAFQWVNPKVWLACTSAVAVALGRDAEGAFRQAVAMGSLFALICLPCFLPWLALGVTMRRVLSSDLAFRRFHLAMGALLAASAIAMVW